MVMSGFLGAGKTTVMMALTDHLTRTGRKAAMISNDLGGRGLADYRYSKAAGIKAEEISGSCICNVTQHLVERLRRLYTDDECQLVMSDIPGFGVGALKHVYYRLRDLYPDDCRLAPFTVVTEGSLLEKWTDEFEVLIRSQLLEGDLIVLNKADLYTDEEKETYLDLIRTICPKTPVILVSALTGEGIPDLADYLYSQETGFPEPDFGFSNKEFQAAFRKLSMYNCQYYTEVCCNDFDANDYLTDLACRIKDGLKEQGYDVPHLKLFAQREDGAYSRADLLGVDKEVILSHRMEGRCVDLPVVINTTSAAAAPDLSGIIDQAIDDVSGLYNLSVVIYFKECFGLH